MTRTGTQTKGSEKVERAKMASDLARNDIPKGTLVTVEGLESEAGKKLNGGLGIILDSASSVGGVLRCPVRIFAVKKEEKDDTVFSILSIVQDRNLNTTNVIVCPDAKNNELFRQAAYQHIEEASTAKAKNEKAKTNLLLFWLETYCHVRPQAFYMGFSYANALRVVEQKNKESAQLIWSLHQQHPVQEDPRYPNFYRETVSSYCAAQMHMEDALQFALKIPLEETNDTDVIPSVNTNASTANNNRHLRREALAEFSHTCKAILTSHKGLGVKDIAQLHLQASQELLNMDPADISNLEYLAGAYCLAGENYEGAKRYRQVLARGASMEGIKDGLILAQLQSPGMPLAEYHLLTSEVDNTGTTKLTCVHNSDTNKLKVNPDTGEVTATDELEAIAYSMPNDPNDPETFSGLLVQLKQDVPEMR